MPAGLSSSTLNLKFMQRAAARTPTSAPSTPAPTGSTSTPSKPDGQPGSSTPTPLPDGTETPTIASEEPYRWKLSRPARPAQPALLIPTTSGPRFETSYLPFMDQEADNEAGPSRSTNGGGGRMKFGYVEPEQEDVDEDLEGGDDHEADRADDDVVINVRENGKEGKKHGRTQSSSRPRSFLRPRSRSASPQRPSRPSEKASKSSSKTLATPSTSSSSRPTAENRHTSTGKDKQGTAATSIKTERPTQPVDRPSGSSTPKNRPADIEIKQEPPSQRKLQGRKRKQSQASSSTVSSNTPTSASQNEKKPRLEPSLLNDHPSQSSQPGPASRSTSVTATSTVGSSASSPAKTTGTLDDRENALKAQRQKEKRARKKAKKAAGKAES